jgi:molybdenum cofactor cytidylyltransferase
MIGGVLLAAGNSTRFGANKLLEKLPNNASLLAHCAQQLLSAVDQVVVVVESLEVDVLGELSFEPNIQLCRCPESKNGMGHSIVCGVSHLREATGWLVALSDMPFIKTDTFNSVATALKHGALIAVPVYKRGRGHPVGFSKSLFSELTALRGDVGARHLIKKYQTSVVEVACYDPGIRADVDTPEDLEIYTKVLLNP